MKIIPLAVLFLMANLQLSYAPENNVMWIPESKPLTEVPIMTNDYDDLIDVIFLVEASRNTKAYNKKENAVGGLQVRQCRLDHYNQLTGKNYTLNDMYDFNKAKEIFLYFTNHDRKGREIPPKSYQRAARDWNGSGKQTLKYWNKIISIKPEFINSTY